MFAIVAIILATFNPALKAEPMYKQTENIRNVVLKMATNSKGT